MGNIFDSTKRDLAFAKKSCLNKIHITLALVKAGGKAHHEGF